MKRFWKWVAVGLFIGCILGWSHWHRLPHGRLIVDFLDVGQGDSILITTPDAQRILIDGGPEQTVLTELGEVMPFLHRRLDLVVLTHPHADHVMGLVQVLRRYDVGGVLISGVTYKSDIYDAFLAEVAEQHIPLTLADDDADWRWGEVTFNVLYPFSLMMGASVDNVNNASVVLLIEYKGHRILLSGDVEQAIEAELLAARVDLDADIFKAGHHGSRTSSTEAFLDAVRPDSVIIQSGEGNSYDHPHPETLEHLTERDIDVYRNDLHGRVRVKCGEEPACQISTENSS